MRKHYFTKQSISDFIIYPDATPFSGATFFINLVGGKQLSYQSSSEVETKRLESALIEMLTSKIYTIIGCLTNANELTFERY